MEVKDIIELMKAVSDNGLTKFELEQGEMKLVMKREKEIVAVAGGSPVVSTLHSADSIVYTETKGAAVQSQETGKNEPDGNIISCPLVGTFYASPSPEAECFVKVGDHVKKGQVVGIVEAMKLMNEIESEVDGEIAEILVKNGEAVEFGQPLFKVR